MPDGGCRDAKCGTREYRGDIAQVLLATAVHDIASMEPSTICFRTTTGTVARQGNVIVVLYSGALTTEHMERLDAVLGQVRAEHPDGCTMVSLVHPSALGIALDSAQMTSFIRQHQDFIEVVAVIVEHGGFGAAAIRTVATAMNLAARRSVVKVFADRRNAILHALEAIEPNSVARCTRLPELDHLLHDLEAGINRIAV
jgi:hypothetical protein